MICNLSQYITNTYYSDYKFFFSKPNVFGIGYGYKIKNKINTYEPCILVFVTKKISPNSLPHNFFIPSIYKGIKTDVIESSPFEAVSPLNTSNTNVFSTGPYTSRIRPIQPSYSMSNSDDLRSGTFGYIVTDNTQVSKTYCLLGTNNTFASLNYGVIGEPILQPSTWYGGRNPQDTVGKLLRYNELIFSSEIPNTLKDFNTVDAAIASFYNVGIVQLINPRIPVIGFLKGITTPILEQLVQWTGSTIGHKTGTVNALNAILSIKYDSSKIAWFKDITLINGDASLHDIGTLICEYTEPSIKLVNAIGLFFAKSNGLLCSCSLGNIQQILDVTLLIYNP